ALGAGDRARGRRVGLGALEQRAADDAVRGAQIDGRARIPDLLAAERDEVPDQRADQQAGEQQPPPRDDRTPVAAEVDLLLGLEIRLPRAQGAATLTEAHSHWARKPSSNAVVARQPRSRSIVVASADVRRTSPAAAGRSTTSRLRPETASSVPITSRIVASSPPPTLYTAPVRRRSIAAIVAATPPAT